MLSCANEFLNCLLMKSYVVPDGTFIHTVGNMSIIIKSLRDFCNVNKYKKFFCPVRDIIFIKHDNHIKN
ncbi:MAG: hypothetical protein DAHOPDDO_02408 [Ignavibacteriaceae bacterium]|nr:hypothetical protein [Ignavibacteriaceae bacterium]